MKYILFFICAFGVLSSHGQTCSSYFDSKTQTQDGAKKISLLRSQMEALAQQMELLRSVDEATLFQSLFKDKLNVIQPQISHLKALIGNLRKVLEGHEHEIRSLSLQRALLLEREKAISSKAGKMAQMGAFLHRLLLSKSQTRQSLKVMSESVEELRALRLRLKVIKDAETASVRTFQQKEEPAILVQIMRYEEALAKMKEDAYVEAAYEARQKLEDSQKAIQSIDSEYDVIAQVLAKEWLLLQSDLYAFTHANQELLSKKSCESKLCVSVGEELLSTFQSIVQAVDGIRLSKQYILRRNRYLGIELDLRNMIHKASVDSEYLEQVRRRDDLDAIEEAVVDEVEAIIQNRNTIFQRKEQLVQRIQDLKSMISGFVRIENSGLVQEARTAQVKDSFMDLYIVVDQLVHKVSSLSSFKDVSLKQYESVRSLALISILKLESLLAANRVASQTLERLSQGDRAWSRELESFYEEFYNEFSNNSAQISP